MSITFFKSKKFLFILFQIILFAILVDFFLVQCPVVVYDCDDWQYISTPRIPLPLWGAWNPSKILPEILMPFSGWIGAYIIYPLTGNYIHSLTISCSIIISLCILLMCICIGLFFHKRFNASIKLSLCYEFIFFIFCFAIFRTRGTSRNLFQARDLNCIYNYTIPGVFNAAAIFIMMSYENFQAKFKSWNLINKILFIVLIYLSVFSNLFQSSIIAIYCFVQISASAIQLILAKKQSIRSNISKLVSSNLINFGILFLWIIAAIFETSGGRANYSGNNFELALSINMFVAMIQAIAKSFLLLTFVCIVFLISMAIYNKKKKSTDISKISNAYNRISIFALSNTILITAFLIVLCSRVTYMSRIEGSWAIWFYLVFICVVAISYFVYLVPMVKTLMPLLIIVVTLCTLYPNGRFLSSTVDSRSYDTCVTIDQYIIDQIVDADQKGKADVTVSIPDYTDTDFAPMLTNILVENINDTLYRHGIINNKITVNTYVDPTINEKLNC